MCVCEGGGYGEGDVSGVCVGVMGKWVGRGVCEEGGVSGVCVWGWVMGKWVEKGGGWGRGVFQVCVWGYGKGGVSGVCGRGGGFSRKMELCVCVL